MANVEGRMSEVIRKNFNTTPGLTYIVSPDLAFVQVLMLAREKDVHIDLTTSSVVDPVDSEIIHDPAQGRVDFNPSRPFEVGEKIVTVIKRP